MFGAQEVIRGVAQSGKLQRALVHMKLAWGWRMRPTRGLTVTVPNPRCLGTCAGPIAPGSILEEAASNYHKDELQDASPLRPSESCTIDTQPTDTMAPGKNAQSTVAEISLVHLKNCLVNLPASLVSLLVNVNTVRIPVLLPLSWNHRVWD